MNVDNKFSAPCPTTSRWKRIDMESRQRRTNDSPSGALGANSSGVWSHKFANHAWCCLPSQDGVINIKRSQTLPLGKSTARPSTCSHTLLTQRTSCRAGAAKSTASPVPSWVSDVPHTRCPELHLDKKIAFDQGHIIRRQEFPNGFLPARVS